jgi:hypothetical protein
MRVYYPTLLAQGSAERENPTTHWQNNTLFAGLVHHTSP